MTNEQLRAHERDLIGKMVDGEVEALVFVDSEGRMLEVSASAGEQE